MDLFFVLLTCAFDMPTMAYAVESQSGAVVSLACLISGEESEELVMVMRRRAIHVLWMLLRRHLAFSRSSLVHPCLSRIGYYLA